MSFLGRSASKPTAAVPVSGRRRWWTGVLRLGIGAGLMAGPGLPPGTMSRAEGQAQASADLLVRDRPASGLLTLRSDYRDDPYVDASALVWVGGPLQMDELTGDVVAVQVGLRDPGGHARVRLGRFILSTGAVRPVHVDGLWLWSRAPTDTRAEVFAGVPVADGLDDHAFDWLLGGRISQALFDERLQVGTSYIHQRDAGQVANEEAGLDLSLHAGRAFWLSAVGAWDVTYAGLAAAELHSTWKPGRLVVRGFAARRVAARLLQATSLFSTISDSASSEAGTELELPLFPRLDVGTVVALQWLDGLPNDRRGYRLTVRGRLRLDDTGDGQVRAELSRRGGLDAAYNAIYVAIEQALNSSLRFHGAGELVAADQPLGDGAIWPWVNAGLRWDPWPGVYLAAALVARASPEYSAQYSALVRIGVQERKAVQ